jgi:hypothetical protein
MSKRGLHLYKRLALTTVTALIGLGGAAQADTHAGGPVYGGLGNGTIWCRVFNFGAVPVTISSREIYAAANSSGTGTRLTLSSDNCSTLATLQTCAYTALITGDQTYSCRVVDQATGSTSLSVLPAIVPR